MLILTRESETVIRGDAKKAYPNECCGALMGIVDDSGSKTVKQTRAIINAQAGEEQYHRFLITPEDMMDAETAARKLGLDVIGFYHSHPDDRAVPSQFDKDHALPFYSYIIVSVLKGEDKDLKSWELTPDRTEFLPEEIKEGQ